MRSKKEEKLPQSGLVQRGGDSSSVGSQLNGDIDVTAIIGTKEAFAAIRADGSVVTWGSAGLGGDSFAVSNSLDGTIPVEKIFSSWAAFAAVRTDGSVITWGDPLSGGDSTAVTEKLDGTNPVTEIVSTSRAFAAIRQSRDVITWGDSKYGGDSSGVGVMFNLFNIVKVVATDGAFAALREGGSLVITWGNPFFGGDSKYYELNDDGTVKTGQLAPKLIDIDSVPVVDIYATIGAFLAVREDRSIRTWGQEFYGAHFFDIDPLDGAINDVYTTGFGFAVRFDERLLLTWNNLAGGLSSGLFTGRATAGSRKYHSTLGALIWIGSFGKVESIGAPNLGANARIYDRLVAIGKGNYELVGSRFSITIDEDPLFFDQGLEYGMMSLVRWLNSVGIKGAGRAQEYFDAITLNADDTINFQQTQAEITRIRDAWHLTHPSPPETFNNPIASTNNPDAGWTQMSTSSSERGNGNILGNVNRVSIEAGFGTIF